MVSFLFIFIGTFEYYNGDKYTGEWANDSKSGKGRYLKFIIGRYDYSNGDFYEGDWRDGKMCGNGMKH